MRHDKIVARTLLISFVVNVALAAPVAVRQRLLHPDGAGAASEKRLNSDGESELAASAAGSHSSFSASSGDPHSGSIGSAPPSPAVLAAWQQLQLLGDALEPESGSGSEPGSPHHSTPPQSPPPSPPHPGELAAAATNPEADTFFNDALKKKLKIFGGVGAVLGVSGGLLYGLHKLISPPLSKPVGRDLASSDVVGHGAGTLFHGVLHHPQPRKTPELWGLVI